MMKFFTYCLTSLFSHVFSEFSTLAIHAEEEACETGSRLLLLQKKTGNNWLTITEYLNGKAVLETKEQWHIPLPLYKRRRHFLQYIRWIYLAQLIFCSISLKNFYILANLSSRCEYFFALEGCLQSINEAQDEMLAAEWAGIGKILTRN